MSPYREMCKEYVCEFYVRELEERIGYECVRPHREMLRKTVGDMIEPAVESTSPLALCDFITQPYYLAFGILTCTILELAKIYFKPNKKEEETND